MTAVSDLPAWEANTYLSKGSEFQFFGKAYEVLISHVSPALFNPHDSRIALVFGNGGSGRGITNVEINDDGDLIITYTDGTSQNAGHVVGSSSESLLQVESVSVSALNLLTDTDYPIDTSKAFKLSVNGVVYYSVQNPPVLSASGSTIGWDSVAAGFSIEVGNTVVVEYYRVPA